MRYCIEYIRIKRTAALLLALVLGFLLVSTSLISAQVEPLEEPPITTTQATDIPAFSH